MSARLGQPMVVENRPGAGSNIATEQVVRAAADGYTLLLAVPSNAIDASLESNLSFNFIRDIAPVASLTRFGFVMVTSPTLPAKTVPEFIAYAKANPGKINMASPGIGSTTHIFGELFMMMAGVDLVHVPYRASIGYIFPLGNMQGYLNLKGYGEFDANDRPSGYNVWLTFAIAPAAPMPPAASAPMVYK